MKQMIAILLSFFLLASTSALASDEAHTIRITRKESQPSTRGSAGHFTGLVRIDAPFRGDAPAHVYGASVTFEAGARTNWHSHTLGQTLIVTEGKGLVQRWGDPVEVIRPGDIVWIPSGQKHWHGAAPDAAMTHIAIVEHLDGKATEWMEKVSDEQYGVAMPGPKDVLDKGKEQTRAQMLFGDVAPKFAELTDEVLYADVWERPELSKHDRSLITVAALVAMNRPPQLKSHLRLALKNGVTKEELIETITHLAFYAGWPNSVTAIMAAKEQFSENE
jgi:4-carboxymuconolactone decarboxylase